MVKRTTKELKQLKNRLKEKWMDNPHLYSLNTKTGRNNRYKDIVSHRIRVVDGIDYSEAYELYGSKSK